MLQEYCLLKGILSMYQSVVNDFQNKYTKQTLLVGENLPFYKKIVTRAHTEVSLLVDQLRKCIW